MKLNHIYWLIGACALAILALIGFQVTWMRHSQNLLEEQFNNRVNMALCSTVETIAKNQACSDSLRACCVAGEPADCGQNFEQLLQQPEVKTALTDALHFYQIDLPYEVLITPKDSSAQNGAAPFSCSLQPILTDDTHLLQLQFAGKNEYYLQRLGFMVSASVGILLFICLVFGLATYYLLRQKRLSDRNRDFFNQMTHEFRTPLTNIRLASSMLTRKNKDLHDNQYVNIIQRECGHLTHQVENVLYLAGLEKGDYALQKQPVDLKNLVGEVVDSMHLQIRERSAEVTLEADGAPACVIEGDAFHLGNAFRNLLDNSLKYSKDNTKVHIGFQHDASGCRVQFADNGIGLSAKERRKVFQKFHRCEAALRSGEKGFGLGLSYVKKIMELHRGQVMVESEKGRGTRFDLYFPA